MGTRLVHELDARPRKAEFVVLDCATVVPSLAGSEFFGHERGAFTGAAGARDGAFGLADGGTLFLDEVGELALGLQAELLRVVQEGMYKRVGSDVWRSSRFRLVSATNRDLHEEVAAGRFRHDLYHRISGWVFQLPSLRDRRPDIPTLTRFFLAAAYGGIRADLELDPAVTDYLLQREYPGNVRDLRHLVWRMSKRHVGPGPISVGDVPAEDRPARDSPAASSGGGIFDDAVVRALAHGLTLREISRMVADATVRAALAIEGGNAAKAARRLGVTDRALQLRRAAWRGGSGA